MMLRIGIDSADSRARLVHATIVHVNCARVARRGFSSSACGLPLPPHCHHLNDSETTPRAPGLTHDRRRSSYQVLRGLPGCPGRFLSGRSRTGGRVSRSKRRREVHVHAHPGGFITRRRSRRPSTAGRLLGPDRGTPPDRLHAENARSTPTCASMSTSASAGLKRARPPDAQDANGLRRRGDAGWKDVKRRSLGPCQRLRQQ